MKKSLAKSKARNAHTFKVGLSLLAALGLLVQISYSPIVAAAVSPTISIDSITDATGTHFPSFNFSCDADPLFGDVSIAGSGAGSAPPGNIEQYGVEVDWGDGVMQNSDANPSDVVFTADPSSGHSDFTFDYDAGPHTYAVAGAYIIHTRLYHVNPSGNDSTADVAITVDTCVVVIPPGTGILNVSKVIDNTGGGTKVESDFSAALTDVDGTDPAFALSDVANPLTVTEGAYSVAEVADPEYTTTYSADCVGTMAAQEVKDCVITNTFIPAVPQGSLTLTKVVSSGSVLPDAFSFIISPAIDEDRDSIVDDGILDIAAGDTSVTIPNVPTGSYSITETGPAGYHFVSGSGTNCTFDGETATATVAAGNPATDADCTFENAVDDATITVTKVVTNDDGGTAVVSDFPLFVDSTQVTSGQANVFAPGTYTISETNLPGYTASFTGDCDGNGSLTLGEAESLTCTITNNDVAPGNGEVSVSKVIVGDDTVLPHDFTFTMTTTPTSPFDGDSTPFLDAGPLPISLPIGTVYSLVEDASASVGYDVTYSAGCVGTVVDATPIDCVVTNTLQLPPPPPPTPGNGQVLVSKVIVGDDTVLPHDFTFTMTTTPTSSFDGDSTPFLDAGAQLITLSEGTVYSVLEDASASVGYDVTYSADCSGTVVADSSVDCVITNTLQPVAPTTGTLHIVKNLIQDDGATDAVTTFSFQVNNGAAEAFEADGQNDLVLDPGTYTVTEVAADGYDTSYENCSEIQVVAGEEATCTITNDDIAPDNGGNDDPGDTGNGGGGGGGCGTCGVRPTGSPTVTPPPATVTPPPPGRVLGETDEPAVSDPGAPATPPDPEVLGAVDALPVTGIPAYMLLLLALPLLWAIRRDA